MPKKIDLGMERRRIAAAAVDVIETVGLEGARLRDVARAASVTTGAVTHYFDGKDAVLAAALEEIVRRTLSRQDAAGGEKAPRTLDDFIRGAGAYLPVDAPRRQEWRVWLAFWGRAIGDPTLRARHEAHYRAIVGKIADALGALHPQTDRKTAAAAADAVIAAIDGVGARATLEPDAWPPRRQRETLAALLRPLLTGISE